MTGGKFGRIQEISLQDAWPDEAGDFTPWLAENLDELGNALDIPLQLQARESPVGTKRLDILAVDPDGYPVVIENQLYPTDDNHLGRLLIYASGKDAKLVIWVAREIGSEHQKALNWLNQRTDENTQFYGVTVEAWKIDDSKPAPHFSVVVSPAGNIKRPLNDKERQNIEFRRPLAATLKQAHGIKVKTKDDTAGAWCVIENPVLGVPGARLGAGWGKTLAFDAEIKQKDNLRGFQNFAKRRADIESSILDPAVGDVLKWDVTEAEDKINIVVSRPVSIYDNLQAWNEYHDWIIAKFVKLRAELVTAASAGDGN